MKSILLIITLVIFLNKTWTQEWVWGIKASGDIQYSEDTDIAIDNEGNIVVAGYYQLGLKLDTFSLYTQDDYYSDIYLCRMDSAHNIKWLKHIEAGSTYNYGIGVCIDDDKNIYLTGGRNGCIFLSKHDSLGNLIWFCNFNQEFYGQGNDIAIDPFDNVYITGKNEGNTFVAKVDYYGKPIWTKQFIGCHSNGCHGNDIAVDQKGSLYLTGAFQCDSLMIDDFKIENNWSWGYQTFITKIAADGTVQWAKTPIGTTNSIPQIAITGNGILISSEVTTSQINFGNGIIISKTAGGNDGSPFIAKYDFDGNIKWAKIINTYHGGMGTPRDIVTDLDDNIYLIGQAFGGYGGTEMDFYVEKYYSTGTMQFNVLYQTSVSEYGHGIGIDDFGNAYIVGYSQIRNFIGDGMADWPPSVGIAKLNTNSTTKLRPYRPAIHRLNIVCQGETSIELNASGENIRWYSDKFLNDLIYEGNTFNFNLTETDTLYVTQTINNIESWPKGVIVQFSKLADAELNINNDMLFVTISNSFEYQWFYNGDSINGSNQNYCIADTIGKYSVLIHEGHCERMIDTMFIPSLIVKNLNETNLLFYPNPTNNILTIIFENDSLDQLNMEVLAIDGKVLLEKKIIPQNGFFIDYVNMGTYPKGIYLLNLIGQGVHETRKVIRN
jgi:hypothetical protein